MKNTAAAVLALVLVVGCAHQLSERNATIVMAKEVEKAKGATGISDAFTYEGQIVAYVTLRWEPLTAYGGAQTVEAKWFNGDKEVLRSKHDANLGRPPWYVWLTTRGTALGAGNCRVEIYANGVYLGQKAFTVTEK